MANDCAHAFGHFPVVQMVVWTSMKLSSDVRISGAGMLSMPGDLPIFSDLRAVSISCLRIVSCGSSFALMIISTAVSPVTR